MLQKKAQGVITGHHPSRSGFVIPNLSVKQDLQSDSELVTCDSYGLEKHNRKERYFIAIRLVDWVIVFTKPVNET